MNDTHTYTTRFSLEFPVNDIQAAQDYLTSDDMTGYLRDDIEFSKSRDACPRGLEPEDICHIEWTLKSDDHGSIILKTAKLMSDDELNYISEWVSGQNSDGLGEGFEQQDFAYIEDEYGNDYDVKTSSFDWRYNKYEFRLIS